MPKCTPALLTAPSARNYARRIARTHVSGRYRCAEGGYEVELRVDVDGRRPTRRVSADYFRSDGETSTYIGSMRVDAPVVAFRSAEVRISGTGAFSWDTQHKGVRITIALAGTVLRATLTHVTRSGAAGATYVCVFAAESFRTVQLVESAEKPIVKFSTYDTGLLPSGGAARSLSAVAAFGEAGIEAIPTAEVAEVDTSIAGANAAWSDAELHAAMELSFSRWIDRPQWAVWLLHAALHEDPAIFGLMFDRQGLQRQGCAVFYHGLSPTTPQFARELLRVCVHEIGHAFNLPHCWQGTHGDPPLPSRPGACSWMNYPERFPGGPGAYWKDFDFGFDDVELAHLRHGFRDSVIMGGAPFAGAPSATRSEGWDAEVQDRGLRLVLHPPAALAQGVPVTVGLELAVTTAQGRMVAPVLGPRPGTVDVAIRDPRGQELVFQPLLRHCRGPEAVALRAGDPPIRDYAFLHYGRRGFTFGAPGVYQARARYTGPDGSVALSRQVAISVRPPATRAEREVLALVDGDDEVGKLLSLMGSDARALRGGNATLDTIIERYPANPVADIARVVRGANLARGFKRLDPDGSVEIRPPDNAAAALLVGSVVDIARMHGAAARASRASPDIATRPAVAPPVHAFVNSRRSEINSTVRARSPQPQPA